MHGLFLEEGLTINMRKSGDALHSFAIKLEQEDIDDGVCGDSRNCALSKAMQRQPGFENLVPMVGQRYTKIINVTTGTVTLYSTPTEIGLAIKEFDKGNKNAMLPGVYVFGVPQRHKYNSEVIAAKAEYNRKNPRHGNPLKTPTQRILDVRNICALNV